MARLVSRVGEVYKNREIIGKGDAHPKNARWILKCLACGEVTETSWPSLSQKGCCSCLSLAKRTEIRGRQMRRLWHTYKFHAKRRGLEWSLTPEDVASLAESPCDYCGHAGRNVFTDRYGASLPYNGIDRVSSDAGYTVQNTVACCGHCNLAKRGLSRIEFISWVGEVFKHVMGEDPPR